MSLIQKIYDKLPDLTLEQIQRIKIEQIGYNNRLLELQKKIAAIDGKSGEKILALVASIGLNTIGIPIVIPPQLGYMAAGFPLGLILTEIKFRKLKPLYEEVNEIVSKMEGNANILKLYEETTFQIPENGIPKNPLTGEDPEQTATYKAEQAKAAELAAPKVLDNIGLGELQRSTGITDNGVYILILLLLVVIIFYFKNRQQKPKNRKR